MRNSIFTSTLTIVLLAMASPASAISIFYDDFDYGTTGNWNTNGATPWTDEGWTNVVYTGANNMGVGDGFFWGNAGGGDAYIEYAYGLNLSAGDSLTLTAEIGRTAASYIYIPKIFLWDGTDPGTRTEVAGNSYGGGTTLTETYTVQASDISQGNDHVIFQYGHGANWGETNSVNFDVTSVPEPNSTALIGLGGLAILLRRKR